MTGEAATHSTWQLSEVVLKLRDDLSVAPRLVAGEPATWMIEDERTGRFYRVGEREYAFLSRLDGRRSFGDVLGRTAAALADRALSEEEAAGLCRWLVDTGLATTGQSRTAARILHVDAKARTRRAWGWVMNPLSQQIPLCRPDRLFAALAGALGWVFSLPLLVAWLCVVVAGAVTVGESWDEFRASTTQIAGRDNWVWLAAIWGVLKLIHEAAHGVACRRMGGTVGEAGFNLVLFVPLPYVDVTSTWRIGSKWRRILVSAAGMGVELFVGAVAALLWSQAEPGLVRQHLHAVVISATAMTLLFNANPLMRFDGYFILTDLLGMPNLASHGQQAWRQLGRRWLLGLPGELPTWPEGRTWLVLAYGCAALVWRVLVCVGLVLAADALFLGAGVVLAVVAMLAWGVLPLGRLLWFVARGTALEQPSRLRFALVMLLLLGGLGSAGQWLHWTPRREAAAVVAYYPPIEIRAAVPGFVDQVLVRSNTTVAAGEELLRLANPELMAEVEALALELAQSNLKADQFLQRGELAAWDAERERGASLAERQSQLATRTRALVVRAPRAGRVLTANVPQLAGRYVQAGEPLLTLGGDGDKCVLALVEPASHAELEQAISQSIPVRVEGRMGDKLAGRIASVAGRADRALPHPALGAHYGGPLATQPTANRESGADVELIEPRLLVALRIDSADESRLRAGEMGVIRFAAESRSLSDWLRQSLSDWWVEREAALRDAYYR